MLLSKVFAEAKKEAASAFAGAFLAAIVIALFGLSWASTPNYLSAATTIIIVMFVFFSGMIFCGTEGDNGDRPKFWGKIFASIFIMALLFFGFGFGLLHGLYSPLKTYWPYAFGAILISEEALYWLDNSQVGNIIPLTTNQYVFTVQKKLEAFFEIFLFLGAVGVVDAAPAAFLGIVTVLADAAIVIGAILAIVAFIWANSLKWKKPKSPVEFDRNGNLKQVSEDKATNPQS